MGLLDDTTHKAYYQGNDHGNYQFISLDDIITQFEIAYVGENKIISSVNRVDIAFHAQRALQELSFDTFKSIKAQQIDVPASLTMILPHDYVNYTKLSWVDSAGIKHLLYPTSATSNPFQIKTEDDSYAFPEELELIVNNDFEDDTLANKKPAPPWYRTGVPHNNQPVGAGRTNYANIVVDNGILKFSHRSRTGYGTSIPWGHAMAAWQKINVSDQDFIDISATGTAVDMTNGPGVLRFGISSNPGDTNTKNSTNITSGVQTTNVLTSSFDLVNAYGKPSYLEWSSDDGAEAEKELLKIDVTQYDEVYVLIVSYQNFTGTSATLTTTNYIDDLSATNSYANNYLTAKLGNEKNSSTWNSYKSTTPSENNNDDYEDDTYWPIDGERYGLDPQHAQINGSFYIDNRLGRIHFSSNISGKTVILDYISDSVGTDKEMKVHKFAEEAMYKWIAHAILSTRSNTQEYLVQRFKKERFAAIRTAKLRLSNLKLEELTQILRGKSKQIKH